MPHVRERYGIDAPKVVAGFSAVALLLTALVFPVTLVMNMTFGYTAAWVTGIALGGYTLVLWASLAWTVAGSVVGKRREWALMLDELSLRGDERVLEVGPGRGAVLVQIAQRLTTGRAVGIDLWRTQDQSGNSQKWLLDNAHTAGVADRIEAHTGDMRSLPFPDASFDLTVASLAIHNVPAADQEKVVTELVRVLKPGGRVVILDFRQIEQLAAALREAGAREITVSNRRWRVHPSVRVVRAAV